ncbi:MAG TPA: LytTR family DNA-binding domain-containing protein [Bacteroidales bacterium]|nr:LytTR family DNA-binding domain-containing protein [Bacteroidales bacterium]
MRIVIIEDEKFTAMDLADTLAKIDSHIEISAILSTVEAARKYFTEHAEYDLIFSDIQLPDGLSFEIFKSVQINAPVIFCTAFDKYALEAFSAQGIDYILKPFNTESVAKALGKYQTLKATFNIPERNLNQIIERFGNQVSRKKNSIIIYRGDKIVPLEIDAIALFYLEDNFAFAVTFDSQKHLITQNLEELETLCGSGFFRANRQFLVNRKAVKDASRYFSRKMLINLSIRFPEQILVGKLKTTQFLQWLTDH